MPPSVETLLPVFVHTCAIYIFLIVMIRFCNRRQLGQLTVIDLVIIILLGSAVETAMVNANTTLAAGLVCASTLLLLNILFARVMCRSKRLRHLVLQGPVLLVHDGQFVESHLRRIGFTHEDVMQAIREREYADVADVRFAVLETDGRVNVIPMKPLNPRDADGEIEKHK